ncbi:MAG TPA: SipW-dependent-type signal peptide-containing protein [Candidatus Gemmiger avium]|nr:SipW-dependent-type signal peptide-containing protein [Candidatus Gemmiger avium]
MKKRNLLVAALSLCLVAIIAVGGTLAYFTDQTQTVTNTFTSGEVDIVLWESSYGEDGNPEVLDPTKIAGVDGRTYTGINFTNIIPGDKLYKNPTVSTSPSSVNSYVAMRLWVTGVDGAELSEEDYALSMELVENSVTRISTNCESIPAKVSNNDFSEPTTTTPVWKAFRLNDGSFLLVATGSMQSLVDTDGDGEKESIKAPLNQVPPGINLDAFDAIYVGKDGSEYGNELAGLSFELNMEAFAMQADNLPTKYNRESVTGWEWFAHTVVDTCNGDADGVFESYKDDAPFNNK